MRPKKVLQPAFGCVQHPKADQNTKKVFQPAFGCTQHPKAGRDTQQTLLIYYRGFVTGPKNWPILIYKLLCPNSARVTARSVFTQACQGNVFLLMWAV